MLERDWDLYSFVTGTRGYAGARVDIRGTGRSEGTLPEWEYSEQEWADGDDGDRVAGGTGPWCTGAVGMWGISWGGFNSIQMAMRPADARRAPAIVAVDATDHAVQRRRALHRRHDARRRVRHHDRPPERAVTGARLPDSTSETLARASTRRRGSCAGSGSSATAPFWRRGSLAPDYERLTVPALLIGGWYDGYRDSVPRMLERCTGSRCARSSGPWNHTWPHDAVPGPEIEWRHETARWWDRWLKDDENGIDREPPFAVYVRDWYRPGTDVAEIPGRWRLEDGWPLERLRGARAGASRGRGTRERCRRRRGPHAAVRALRRDRGGRLVGRAAARPGAVGRVRASSTRPRRWRSRCEILGFPRVELHAAVDAPLAHFFARLCDVAPDGSVGTRRRRRDERRAPASRCRSPADLVPGEVHDIAFELHVTSWVFPAGHRIRLAVSNACFPMIWPTPHPMTLSLSVGRGRLTARPAGRAARGPAGAVLLATRRARAAARRRVGGPRGADRLDDPARGCPGDRGLERQLVQRVPVGSDPRDRGASLRGGRRRSRARLRVGRGDYRGRSLPGRSLRWRGVIDLSSDETTFLYRYTRELTENGEVIRTRTWEERVPRDHQ